MSTLVTVHIVLLSLILAICLIGFFLPKRKAVRREVEITALPEEIWRIATRPERQPQWRKGLKKVDLRERTPDTCLWTEYPVAGSAMTYQMLGSMPYRRYETETTGSRGMKIHRVLDLEKISIDVTRVVVTEYVDVKNPFTRVVAYLQFDPGAAIDQYLHELSAEAARIASKLESQTS
jgi:hypothetical protein